MTSDHALYTKEWDYTHQAPYYYLRPNYAAEAIDILCQHVRAGSREDYMIADVGAGTGNLTLMLTERGLKCLAIEPNAAMRQIGIERTRGLSVKWIVGSGEHTTLPPASVDLFAMGSSFNCTHPAQTLQEAYTVTRPGGYFTCMWNHRDLHDDPVQRRVEAIIRAEIPDYQHGRRRQDQRQLILASGLFTDVTCIEVDQLVKRKLEDYLTAWRSVRNRFWDFESSEGRRRFSRIMDTLRRELREFTEIHMKYTTRLWIAKRADS